MTASTLASGIDEARERVAVVKHPAPAAPTMVPAGRPDPRHRPKARERDGVSALIAPPIPTRPSRP